VAGCVALALAILLAAWILSARIDPPPQRPVPTEPPPQPLQPRTEWKAPAEVINDAQAVSALILAFDGRWADANRHAQAMHVAIPRGDTTAARDSNEAGLARYRKGDFAAAAEAFERARRADPGDPEVENNLGYALMKAGRIGDGVPPLMRALRLVPGRSSAWANLGEALAELGHEDASLAALLLAARFGTKRQEVHDFFAASAKSHPSEAFRRQAGRALERIDSVPRG
jgi:tetratricopeptide (TPR) repeat protein